MVDDAVVEKKFVVVALVSAAEFAERTPKVAEVEYKFVLLAVVLKRVVVVAFASVVLPFRYVEPETESAVEEA